MRLAALLVFLATDARADVDLFPKQAIEKQARPDSIDLPPDSPWRSVERKAFGLFSPTLSSVTDETPPQLLARQLARKREPAAHSPERKQATLSDLSPSREDQVDAAQAAYEEPAVWQAVEIEVVVDEKGAVLGARIVHGSGRPRLDAAALEAVKRSAGAVSSLGARGAVRARFVVEAGAAIYMPARSQNIEPNPRPKGAIVPIARGRFGSGRKTEVNAPLQPYVRTRVTLIELTTAK